jgi:hypothetical protein
LVEEADSKEAGAKERIYDKTLLDETMQNLEKLEPTEDYTVRLIQVLLNYLHIKLKTSTISTNEIIQNLKHTSNFELAEDVNQLLNDCQLYLFASVLPNAETRERHLSISKDIIAKMEQTA